MKIDGRNIVSTAICLMSKYLKRFAMKNLKSLNKLYKPINRKLSKNKPFQRIFRIRGRALDTIWILMKIICPNRSKDTQSFENIFSHQYVAAKKHFTGFGNGTGMSVWLKIWICYMEPSIYIIQCIESSENFAFLHPAGYIIRFIL